MRTYRVLVTPTAETSIRDAFRYIQERSPLDAERWLLEFQHALATLERHPERCPPAPESQYLACTLRHLLFHSHRIVYRIEAEPAIVRVLYVRHMAQRAAGEPVAEGSGEVSEA
ncbi:MAG: type II toxin-antitoxin system RelE/ParE family toxin [Phycisphaerales bacterium]|nr:type II toxin-antitoxin system RelE/ParE family toxin [Phycisphaerales bacterium]